MREKYIYQNGVAWILTLVLIYLINLPGCASSQNESSIQAGTLPSTCHVEAEETEYILNAGDQISVSFFYFPRFNTTLKIRPDGYISIAPIDDVKAAGLTSRELDEKLTRLYAERIENAELTVSVKEFSTQKVYVGGEVRDPGTHDLERNMTALEAIFKARGALNTGNLDSVMIIRKKGDGTPYVFSINLAQDIKSNETKNNIFLRPLDVVYVPKTLIAKINQFVDQYIDKLIPISLNAGFSYVISDDRTVTVAPR
ncbi:MAG: polysaccharide biosynthesis/export family protein [Proteobacteria bacterium]|nr:polysaccharide biosynthesis/export family protein [Pseudomonadota bacterium]